MVRFIIFLNRSMIIVIMLIYIPIWLDLLSKDWSTGIAVPDKFTFQYGQIYYPISTASNILGTLIYIPIWLDLLLINFSFLDKNNYDLHSNMVRFIILYANKQIMFIANLHSNMVRFIISGIKVSGATNMEFTFQYGQIYYNCQVEMVAPRNLIYIPIWLDLL